MEWYHSIHHTTQLLMDDMVKEPHNRGKSQAKKLTSKSGNVLGVCNCKSIILLWCTMMTMILYMKETDQRNLHLYNISRIHFIHIASYKYGYGVISSHVWSLSERIYVCVNILMFIGEFCQQAIAPSYHLA